MGEDAGSSAPSVGTPRGDDMIAALRAATRVLGSSSMRQSLQDDPDGMAGRLGLPKEAAPQLLNLLNAVERSASSPASPENAESRGSQEDPHDPEVRRILMEPFRHIRWTFMILTAMSILTFLLGLAFLLTALVRSVHEHQVSSATITIGGLGLADFVLLFYRRPWEDIARGLSNSQQARIIATSYLSGASLINPTDPQAQAALRELTQSSVEMLERFTEPNNPSGKQKKQKTANSPPEP
jgi:hypothetical protein